MLILILHTIVSIGSSLMLRANGQGGSSATVLATHFAKRNTKFGGGEKARAGKNSFPPNSSSLKAFQSLNGPLPFCPPERSVWRGKRAVNSVQKRFGFRQTNAPELNFQEFCRLIQPREARQRTETLARRARRGSPSVGSKSLAILSICFAQLKTNNINL